VDLYIYSRLFVFTAGLLLSFFWLTVILGHRRQRTFERILFFVCLSLFLFYAGSLLALNAELHYLATPLVLQRFAWSLICLGLTAIPSLFVHLHTEYASIRGNLVTRTSKLVWLFAGYGPLLYFLPRLFVLLRDPSEFDFLTPINAMGNAFKIWLALAFLVGLYWQRQFATSAAESEEKSFHRQLVWQMALAASGVFIIHLERHATESARVFSSIWLAGLPLLALGTLVRKVQKFNFLQIGRQSNLIYAVVLAFVALLYLSLVRRVSQWFEPAFPPEATAAVLLFLPVVFFEPLQRIFRASLRNTAHNEMDLTQRMMGPIQEVARLGNLAKLVSFVEQWAKSQFQLACVALLIYEVPGDRRLDPETGGGSLDVFSVQRANRKIGELRVVSHGAMLSGETFAALEFLCEQLPAAFDLCRLIEEKLRLERELAERERMAALGQMAASISHNLKNPLGSIKTILQVQIESRDLPENFRCESQMVLEEVNRLSAKLNQLLQFSRPAVLGQPVEARCDVGEVLREVTEVLRPEAEHRGVTLERSATSEPLIAAIGREALNDIVTNLLVNALDAVSPRGRIQVGASNSDGWCTLLVEDGGPGIPPETQDKILQPFFTTKPQGTGLGLAIVARRVAEAQGQLDWQSPVQDGRGTRFQVRLPRSASHP